MGISLGKVKRDGARSIAGRPICRAYATQAGWPRIFDDERYDLSSGAGADNVINLRHAYPFSSPHFSLLPQGPSCVGRKTPAV
ncbi:hypothetical protein AtDm6_0488 [Acetobacter tropicalis]|uniref:Uncharacterized protein n=1 Tax=Acetobacter tropicalis TaxID=104102 RepID=A0A094YZW8_9PROT|nr:hypothetical protein AtDm6_0488 [Acetobacter tropicalis]